MTDWFTVETIDNDTFAISEYRHWEETHCYLLCGTEKAILIDTGLGVANIKNVVGRLTEMPIMVVTMTNFLEHTIQASRWPDFCLNCMTVKKWWGW